MYVCIVLYCMYVCMYVRMYVFEAMDDVVAVSSAATLFVYVLYVCMYCMYCCMYCMYVSMCARMYICRGVCMYVCVFL